jgi:hypothetical protein
VFLDDSLRGFLSRLLGWTNADAVDQAIRSIELAVAHHAHLVLRGPGDLVPIARALHRRTIGADRPFIVCDPRRRDVPASARSPANHDSGVAAFEAARGGSLCVRSTRLPRDFSSVRSLIRARDARVQFIICAGDRYADDILLTMPAPIIFPPLEMRSSEVPRIVDEYAIDAIKALGARPECLTADDRAWVVEHQASSLSEIEKATLRLVALRISANTSIAAALLGIAPVSLFRWMGRRAMLPMEVAASGPVQRRSDRLGTGTVVDPA